MTTHDSAVVLEPAAQAFAEATANPPFLFDMPVEQGRKTVDLTDRVAVSGNCPAVSSADVLARPE